MKINAKAGSQLLDVIIERNNGGYQLSVGEHRYDVDVQKLEGDFYTLLTDGRSYEVSVQRQGDGYLVRHGAAAQCVTFSDPSRRAREAADAAEGPEKIVSMMPGKVVRLLVKEGDKVETGQGLIVVEAMKMENEITAGKAGCVVAIDTAPGQSVESGAVLMVVE